MSSIEVKTFDNPDESNTNFKNAKIDIVKVGDQRVMRLVLQPGWKWSQDIKPTVGTDSCKAKHLGVIVSGAVCAKHDDGTELTYAEMDFKQKRTFGHRGRALKGLVPELKNHQFRCLFSLLFDQIRLLLCEQPIRSAMHQ